MTVAALFVALAFAPGGAALTDYTFVDVAPGAVLTFNDGAGIYDPTDPDNTCAALLGLALTEGGTFYYNHPFRVYSNADHVQTFPGASVSDDPTDCAGFGDPGSPNEEIGASDGNVRIGSRVHHNVHFFSCSDCVRLSSTWTIQVIPITSPSSPLTTTMTGTLLYSGATVDGTRIGVTTVAPCHENTEPADYDASSYDTSSGPGGYGTAFVTPFIGDWVPAGSGDSVVESVACASVFDTVALTTTDKADESWFAVNDDDSTTAIDWASFVNPVTGELDHVDGLIADQVDA